MNSPYEPPVSRPANGGIERTPKSRLWSGFGLGWAAIAFTFLWVAIALPMVGRLTSAASGFVGGLASLLVLLAPNLALMGYFAMRREWKVVLGVLLSWASAIALVLLLVAACLGIMNTGRI